MNGVADFLGRALGFVQGLVQAGVIKVGNKNLPQLAADLQKVANDAGHPSTPTVVADVGALLGDLKANGMLSGTIVDELAKDAGKFGAFMHNISSGQAGTIEAHVNINGVDCEIAAIPYGGPAAAALGL